MFFACRRVLSGMYGGGIVTHFNWMIVLVYLGIHTVLYGGGGGGGYYSGS